LSAIDNIEGEFGWSTTAPTRPEFGRVLGSVNCISFDYGLLVCTQVHYSRS
jgi:hypothetical protein